MPGLKHDLHFHASEEQNLVWWVECKFAIFAILVKTPLSWQGARTRSTGVALHPLKSLVSHLPPPPVPGGVAPKFGSEKVSRYPGVSQLQLRVSRLHCATKVILEQPPKRSLKTSVTKTSQGEKSFDKMLREKGVITKEVFSLKGSLKSQNLKISIFFENL